MSGHSKWSTIKRKKEKTDGQRAKIFTKIGREIGVAVREGGPDPSSNSKLRDVIAKAKANNVPNDNIDRIIKKAAGEGGADNYEEIVYEATVPAAWPLSWKRSRITATALPLICAIILINTAETWARRVASASCSTGRA